MIDAELTSLVNPYLDPGERLVWAARPLKRRFLKGAFVAALFGVPFFGFAVFWEFMAVSQTSSAAAGPGWIMAIFGLPFVGVGAWLLLQPVLVLLRLRRLVYAVTDRRALLVLAGARDGVRGYPPEVFTPLQLKPGPQGSGDVFFAADTKVERFLLEPGAGKGGPFCKVGFFGVPDLEEARRRLEALQAQGAGDSADDTRLASRRSTEPEALLAFQGAYAAVEAKLGSFLKARQAVTEARGKQAWRHYWGWVGGGVLLLASGMFAIVMHGRGAWEVFPFLLFLAVAMAIGSGVGFVAVQKKRVAEDDVLGRGRAIATALARLEADLHPKSKVHGWVDLGEGRTTRPYRMANSLSSGALKTYHKHHWVRLVFATADGNKLAVSVVDRLKFKSGVEVTRQRQVQGRLEVNGAVYDTRRLTERGAIAGLEVCRVVQGSRTTVYFGGVLGEPDDLPAKLLALYRLLETKM